MMKLAVTVFLAASFPLIAQEPKKPTAAKPATVPTAKAAIAPPSAAQPAPKPAPPAAPPAAVEATKPAAGKSETLRFNVNWPSGLSLGEGELTSTTAPAGWTFSLKIDAAIPAFPIAENVKSTAGPDLCSTELTKEATRGRRKVGEKTTFDASKLTATRKTTNMPDGGKTEIRINACAKDALTFIQFLRRELAAGRIPQAQQVYYGAGYQTRVQYIGTQRVRSGNEFIDADKLTAFVKGPASDFTLDFLFARDPSRSPISVTIPVAIGKFTLEFER